MYRFARTPRFILAHAGVALVAAACVGLGLWQLERLSDRRSYNALLSSRLGAPAAPVGALMSASEPAPDVAFRRAVAEGTYDVGREVVLRGRSFQGRAGHHVLTPLLTAEGPALIVDRGWVPYEMSVPPLPQARPPQGRVRVRGVIVPEQRRGPLGPTMPEGARGYVVRLEVARLAASLPYPVYPLALHLEAQEPRQPGAIPATTPLAPLGDGPHLPYAIQWFSFAAIAVATYVALLRRHARRRAAGPETAAG